MLQEPVWSAADLGKEGGGQGLLLAPAFSPPLQIGETGIARVSFPPTGFPGRNNPPQNTSASLSPNWVLSHSMPVFFK